MSKKCKFKFGDYVRVTGGFFEGLRGYIIDVDTTFKDTPYTIKICKRIIFTIKM